MEFKIGDLVKINRKNSHFNNKIAKVKLIDPIGIHNYYVEVSDFMHIWISQDQATSLSKLELKLIEMSLNENK